MTDPRPTTTGAPAEHTTDEDASTDTAPLVESDLLVEEISIDGMCGVY